MTSVVPLSKLKDMGINPDDWSKYAGNISTMTFTIALDANNMPDFTAFYESISKNLIKNDINDTSRS